MMGKKSSSSGFFSGLIPGGKKTMSPPTSPTEPQPERPAGNPFSPPETNPFARREPPSSLPPELPATDSTTRGSLNPFASAMNSAKSMISPRGATSSSESLPPRPPTGDRPMGSSSSSTNGSAQNLPSQGSGSFTRPTAVKSPSMMSMMSSATSFATSMLPSTPTSVSKVTSALTSMPGSAAASIMAPVGKGIGSLTSAAGSAMAPVGKGIGTLTSVAGSAAGTLHSAAETGLSMMMPTDFPTLFAQRKADISGFYDPSMDDDADANVASEEAREYLNVCGHNLHSVLSNPRGGNWGDAILDAFTLPGETDLTISAILNAPIISKRDFDPFMKSLGDSSALYTKNHERPVREQLASANVPTVAAADEDVQKCFLEVPSLYFKPDYAFTDPQTFHQVLQGASIQDTQEKLSGYLDRVEVSLLRQVSSRSDRFFEASNSQNEMKKRVTQACDQVKHLRATMDRLRNSMADKSLAILQLHRRQKRLAELQELVLQIEEMKHTESSVEALVHGRDYTGALDAIDTALRTTTQLAGIHCVRSLGDKLQTYRTFIGQQMSSRFLAVVTGSDWAFDPANVPGEAANPVVAQSLARKQQQTRDEMKALMDALFRLEVIPDVMNKYRAQLTDEIKIVVKTVVSETIESSTAKGPDGVVEANVTVQLRALSSEEFLSCVEMIFEHLLVVLQRAMSVQRMLAETFHVEGTDEAAEVPTGDWSPDEPDNDQLAAWQEAKKATKIVKEVEDAIRKTCEFSQRSVSNLFAVRKEVQATYTMPQLRALYDATMGFVVGLEQSTGKTDYTLRGALFNQVKLFLEKYHQAQVNKLVSTLNHELWKNAEISASRHTGLVDFASGKGVSLVLSHDQAVAAETAPPLKQLTLSPTASFRVVWSVLLTLEILMNYVGLAANFPVVATDIVQRAIELLRLFNSRTTQLVLGAGAMQVAHLKSISAKHLGLASQSLEVIVAFIPHIKCQLALHLTQRQKLLLDDFDKVTLDYVEHNNKIFAKFIAIVEDQIMKKALEAVATEVDYDTGSVPSAPLRSIAANTVKLYQVLSPVLPPLQLQLVFSRVFDMFEHKMPECFRAVAPRTAAGKANVIADIVAFVSAFRELKDVDFKGDALLTHFRTAYKT
ncbi:vacuolar protein sorting-associated protein [Achlya hypogyna]|uniref:Vacuolar protein sorting-associated protein 54 n=1 Tax=Achlya hypogyna TaxID=1202772 RepID=A0A1V9ZPI9_ACHHY|nr:vacuolar protein sorting-associated protein [Achlya hypogyna]